MSSSQNRSVAYQQDRAHVFHSWSAQATLDPLVITGGEGAWYWDEDDNKYLDFSSQLVYLNLGHQHPKMIAALQEQAAKISTIAPAMANPARSQAAAMIAERAPEGLNKVFFTNGGAEATENAVRMARLATSRHKVLTAYRSYHGATTGAMQMTGEPRRWQSEPGAPGYVKFFGPYLYRSAFHATTEQEEAERALAHLHNVVELEGPQHIAAIVLETVVGTNGVLVPPAGYLPGVRALCDRFGIKLILDEVMVGFGRTGEWFACQNFGVSPDMITFAKGVNSGYVPLGGVIISDEIAAVFDHRPYPGGLTYSGHVLGCAAAVASMTIFEEDGILDHVRMLEREVFEPGLRALQDKHPSIGEVRGLGAFWAIELVKNRETREMLVPFNASGPDAAPMNEVLGKCRSLGLMPFSQYNRLHVAPPLVITADEARLGIELLDQALDIADQYVEN